MFSWDARKALANLKKHGVSFEEEATVFVIPMGWITMTLNTRSRSLDPYESVSPLSAGSSLLFIRDE